ncbi:hypothetical protein L6452_27577 [Arctium lappa]|uniref:Uncharacterized protein n=1 Tax=Arctium lappa TaxID=4217 RepID=A0ACB8ZWH9_ARCLA|nr:hypothetical protein L6452_27577 [Arctium lappa]
MDLGPLISIIDGESSAEKQVTNINEDEVGTEIAPEVTSKTKVANPRSIAKRVRMDSSKELSFCVGAQSPASSPRRMKTRAGVTTASPVHVVSPVKMVMMPQAEASATRDKGKKVERDVGSMISMKAF